MSALKILVADDEIHKSQTLQKSLQLEGFDCILSESGADVISQVLREPPNFLVVDLLLPNGNALHCLQILKNKGILNNPTKVIVSSGHSSPSNVKECFKHGAVDYLVKPFTADDLLNKLAFHSQVQKEAPETKFRSLNDSLSQNLGMIEKIINISADPNADLHHTLHRLATMAGMIFPSGRCNFIEASLETGNCQVLAASDDPKLKNLKIDLSRYPEVVHCLNTEKTVALENLNADKVMSQLKKAFKNVQFNSMIVAPVMVRGKIRGVFSVRLKEDSTRIEESEIQMTRIIAHLAGLAWACAT
ncbi:MAG: response regulator [Pseudobdellovibrionaceae bacterium]